MNPSGIHSLALRAVYAGLAIVAIQVFVATPLIALRSAWDAPAWGTWAISIAFAGLLLAIVLGFRLRIEATFPRIGNLVSRPPLVVWLALTVAVGLVLRLLWALIYPTQPSSDAHIYVQLAVALSAGEPYEIAGSRAYWPPGYPLLLAPLFALFGPGYATILALNLALFVGTLVAVYALGSAIGGEVAGRLGAALLALWPTHIAMAGLAMKEYPLILLLVVTVLLLYGRTPGGPWRWVVAGALLGFGALIQPSLLLIPFVFLLADLFVQPKPLIAGPRLVLVILGMALIISPWTVRNYQVFDEFVLISTNGGDNFYRANNPLATGGWTPVGEVDLEVFGELKANALGTELALQWIRENPADFLKLAVEKQVRFLGDDSTGVYVTFRDWRPILPESLYLFWKGIANAYWLLIWVLVFLAVSRFALGSAPPPRLALVPALTFLYFYALHTVFESNGKYHLPVLGLLAVLAAVSVVRVGPHTPPRAQR